MAPDDTPLLPDNTYNTEPGAPEVANKCSVVTSLDDVMERCAGSVGAAQLFQAFVVSLAWAFDAQQTFVLVFTDTAPSWHCTVPDDQGSGTTACSSLSQPCGLPAGTWVWDRPAHASVVSEWSLECAASLVAGLPASAYFAGSLVGGLALGTLADSTLGRKKMLFFACLGTGVAGLLTAASLDVWVYSMLRFASGFSRATISASAQILATELVGKSWQGRVSVVGYFCFTLGFLFLPLLAYAERDSSWRALYLWTSAPLLLYAVLVFFLVRESPRWLLARGRRDDAIKVLKDIAASNGCRDVSTHSFSDVFVGEEEWNKGVSLYSAMRALVAKRWALRRLGALTVTLLGIGMMYFGIPLALGTLGSNLYISVALNALSELPSALVTFFLIGRMDRRSAVLGFALASGACSFACIFLEVAGLRMGVEVTSFFCACTAFDVALIYAMELFPTSVRNSALSLARAALVLGGACAPLLVSAASKAEGRFMSFGVFGIIIACGGMFVLFLPETRGRSICDTLDEEEYRVKYAAAAAAGAGDGEGGDVHPRV